MSRNSLAALCIITAPTQLTIVLFCSALLIGNLQRRLVVNRRRLLVSASVAFVVITGFLQVAWIRGPGLMLASTVEHCGIARGIPLALRRLEGDAYYPFKLDPCR